MNFLNMFFFPFCNRHSNYNCIAREKWLKMKKNKCEWNTINSTKIRENWTMLVVVFSQLTFSKFTIVFSATNWRQNRMEHWPQGHMIDSHTGTNNFFWCWFVAENVRTNLIYSTINGCVHASSLTAQMKMIYFGFFKLISKFYNARQLRVGSHSRI